MNNDFDFENRIMSASYDATADELDTSLRPHRLEEYIVQEKVKENLKVYIEAAKMRGDTLDHVLLYGPPGLGKTTLAAIIAAEMGVNFRVGNILASEIFYNDDPEAWKSWQKMGVLAVEMEASALYMNAARSGNEALCICTISDSLVTHEDTTPEQREKTFTDMMEIAFEII